MGRCRITSIFISLFLVVILALSAGIFAGAKLSINAESPAEPTLRVATGSPGELGLMDALIKPFEEEYHCQVRVIKASTGQGLDLGRKGEVELTIGHSKEALDRYMAQGYGIDRNPLMHNYFVIVGPKGDPAGIRGFADLAQAHLRIAETGSLYLSRGDKGGMHKREKAIWRELGIAPTSDWYKVSHDFMMASLKMADKLKAYHMADSSTWTVMKGKLDNLALLVLGEPNRYEVAAVNPAKFPNVNYKLARQFIEYITSPQGQAIIRDFGKDEYGEPLYYPDAQATHGEQGTLLVYCGAGMRKPMDEIGRLFEDRYGVEVNYNHAGSGQLLSQMQLTKRGDIYMPGATYYFDIAKDKVFIEYHKLVAYHIPVIAVPEGNPANITCLNDLANPGVRVILGDPKACAIGKLADKILEKNGILDEVKKNVIARTVTVNELVLYVSIRKADVSIVWKSSLLEAEDKTDVLEIPEKQNIIRIISIGTLTFSENKDKAREFMDFVTSDEGKAVWEKFGYASYPDGK